MSVLTRGVRTVVFLISCWALAGCSAKQDTTPEADIPDIPPSSRTMPGEGEDTGGKADGFMPAPPAG